MFDTPQPLPPGAPDWEVITGLQWIAHFKQRLLDDQRVSASTLEAYTLDMMMVSQWAADRQQALYRLAEADLAQYAAERLAQGARSSTVSRHISSCRRFYAYLLQLGAVGSNPAASVLVAGVSRQDPALVPRDTLRALLRAPTGRRSSPGSIYRRQRNHALVCTLYGSSLGISDVRLLRWQQIDNLQRTIRVPVRGGKARIVELDAWLLAVLEGLRACMATTGLHDDNGGYCFPTTVGSPMSRQALCLIVRRWARECGQSAMVTPSALRQTGRAHRAAQSDSGQVPHADQASQPDPSPSTRAHHGHRDADRPGNRARRPGLEAGA